MSEESLETARALGVIDRFCNDCKNFDRIMKGKAMAGYCLKHKVIVAGQKQYNRFILPFISVDLGRGVEPRKDKFNLKKDCYKPR